MKNPWLKRLLESVVEDPAIAPRLKRAPAAMTMHHAFLGGLLEHIVSLIGLGRVVVAHYPELDADLLLAGVVLHDIGKIDELSYDARSDYTTAGRLLGHITIGTLLVREKIKAIGGFPEPLAILIEHLILSHHGTYEFGSPSLPQTREAIALHFLDDMDSKMAAMRATLEGASGKRSNGPSEIRRCVARCCAPTNFWPVRLPDVRRRLRQSTLRSRLCPARRAIPAAPDEREPECESERGRGH